MTKVLSHFIQIKEAKIHFLEVGNSQNPSVLFLHGASFKAETWQEIGTLELMGQNQYHAIAVDLPGYGKSQSLSGNRVELLLEIIDHLNLSGCVLVSPSMSGNYSLPFIVQHSDRLGGFVAVAPVGIPQMVEHLQGISLPTLAIWGSNDRIVPLDHAKLLQQFMPNVQIVILEQAGHACYMKATPKFHEHLMEFVNRINSHS
ncbi:alpha/beta fold hydrolase [Planktothrix sp. FACHB-1365]|uniref:alpha/beta fold hydrolase n=1 Tax=Planktothrix sp. FACHB-1365 TaxID=2692855 RepID=UPI001689C974|nr:alpha/beta hydrolase [Planktothrix sp. FACHB-1365]MBD2482830.1 alpha/beta hydrolase [Planktothrix sp. FACHB-1365]